MLLLNEGLGERDGDGFGVEHGGGVREEDGGGIGEEDGDCIGDEDGVGVREEDRNSVGEDDGDDVREQDGDGIEEGRDSGLEVVGAGSWSSGGVGEDKAEAAALDDGACGRQFGAEGKISKSGGRTRRIGYIGVSFSVGTQDALHCLHTFVPVVKRVFASP